MTETLHVRTGYVLLASTGGKETSRVHRMVESQQALCRPIVRSPFVEKFEPESAITCRRCIILHEKGTENGWPMLSHRVVAVVPNLTYRRLDFWCRAGYVPGHEKPLGSGHERRFFEEDVERLRNLTVLSEFGLAPHVARDLLDSAEVQVFEDPDERVYHATRGDVEVSWMLPPLEV